MSPKKLSAKERLTQEAQAFDEQILERMKNGHIPDIRRAQECTYFYNNSWRHPEYVKLDFGEQFEIIRDVIHKNTSKDRSEIKILEVGCGPGYMTLELARNGFDVTGLDLSEKCIEIAKKVAAEDPWIESRGRLNYMVGDFLSPSLLEGNHFNFIIFVGALHHFPDQEGVCLQCKNLLENDTGYIIALEPTRDRVTRENAAVFHMIETLLSAGGGYFKKQSIPETKDEQDVQITDTYNFLRYEDNLGEKVQSVNDNEAGYREMISALNQSFKQIHFEELYGLFHELIGGLRYDQATNNLLARYIRDMDREFCKTGVIQSTEFLYVGKIM